MSLPLIITLIAWVLIIAFIWKIIANNRALKAYENSPEYRDEIRRLEARQRRILIQKDPDYQYLKSRGYPKGFFSDDPMFAPIVSLMELDNLSLAEIKEHANSHRQKVKEEEQKNQEERRLALLKWEEEDRKRRDPIRHYRFELNSANGKIPGVYMIYNSIDEEYYIGSSVNMYNRKLNHLHKLRNDSHHAYKLQKAFNESHESRFDFYVLKEVDFEEEFNNDYRSYNEITDKMKRNRLHKHEQDCIDRFKPSYNVHKDVDQWKKDNYGQGYYRKW